MKSTPTLIGEQLTLAGSPSLVIEGLLLQVCCKGLGEVTDEA